VGATLPKADLSGANLSGAYFEGADLGGADLSGANLERAILWKANLKRAKLVEADFRMAELTQADLAQADLSGAHLEKVTLLKATLRKANLSGANLSGAILPGADMTGADLSRANLVRTYLEGADLGGARLMGADLGGAKLMGADMTGADLREATLHGADLSETNLTRANLTGADLTRALLIKTDLSGATLTHCNIYGISAWDVKLDNANQNELVITQHNRPIITVDNIKIAQFIYLLLNSKEIREAIATISRTVVLILGRFNEERKPILDALRKKLRENDYVPVLFDFEKPKTPHCIETVSILARLARFVIADVTDAKIVLEEVLHIVRTIDVPVAPLLLGGGGKEPVTLSSLRKGHVSLMKTFVYGSPEHLIPVIKKAIFDPAEAKAKELQGRN
jgi:uncharacterized protein YjbI with pentapeptide repeats